MRRLTAILGYTGAALTIAAMMVAPFVLFGFFGRTLVRTGIRVSPTYGGGDLARTVEMDGYQVVVNHPVLPVAPLSRVAPFVQIAWGPAGALPGRIADEVDLDGDGRADLLASFEVPREPGTALHADVTPLGDKVRPLRRVSRDTMSSLIARVDDRIVLRVPLTESEAGRERAARRR